VFKNYLKITFRNIVKHKGYSLINIVGLSLGIASCILILLYVRQELSYDTFHRECERIYRIEVENTRPEGKEIYAPTPSPYAPALKKDYPEIEKIARVYFMNRKLVAYEDKTFYEERFIFADPDFFDMFTFPVVKGNRTGLLSNPNSLVLTSSTAEKYFGDEDPVGKIIRLDNKYDFKVTGVVEDVPINSHFHFDFAAAFPGLNDDIVGIQLDQWGAYLVYTYALFPSNFDAKFFEGKAKPFIEAHVGKESGTSRRILLQPLSRIHLHSHSDNEIEPGNTVSNLLIVSTIGLFILMIACINFVNLSTTQSYQRSREVGVRKVTGATRFQLAAQFLGESLIFAFIALALSFILVELFLPSFSSLVNKEIKLNLINLKNDVVFFGFLMIFPILVGIVSGAYPALVLSRHKPVCALKQTGDIGKKGRGTGFLRKVLVTSQFTISISLIIGTFIVKDQLHFLTNSDLGFKKKYTLVIPIQDDSIKSRLETVKHELGRNPNVKSVTACYGTPVGNSLYSNVYPNGKDGPGIFGSVFKFIDLDYIKHFGLDIIAGRGYSKKFTSDQLNSFIVNEEMVKKLGYSSPHDAVGRKLPISLNNIEGTIIGVVKNFHTNSLHEPMDPLVLIYWPRLFSEVVVTIHPGDTAGTISSIGKTWSKFSPGYPFQYTFLNEDINRDYHQEQHTLNIIRTFSFLAIFIACLGLYGLSAFTAEQRTREIGIRKVLGSTIPGIIRLLLSESTKWVLMANLLAWPIAYVVMNKWLQGFAYRTDIGLWHFLLSGGIAFFIALGTISFLTLRTAFANPIEALRYE
jgi:putative ABC transport system permease protein